MPVMILNPSYEDVIPTVGRAPALSSLAGATVGLLDNNKKNVGQFLDYVEELLYSDYGVAHILRRRKSNMSAPAPPDVMRDLVACDAVIVAIGD